MGIFQCLQSPESINIIGTSIAFSAATAGAVSIIFREFVSKAIAKKFGVELQEHKMEVDGKLQVQKAVLEVGLQANRHDYEVNQLRTSLFFDHQRDAFATILSEASQNLETWNGLVDMETNTAQPLPQENIRQLRWLIRKHQLFLDPECAAALDFLVDTYWSAVHSGSENFTRDSRTPLQLLEDAEYLQPRLAALFQKKIGVTYDLSAPSQIAILAVIRMTEKRQPYLDDFPEMSYATTTLDDTDLIVLHLQSDIQAVINYVIEFKQTSGYPGDIQKLAKYLQILTTN